MPFARRLLALFIPLTLICYSGCGGAAAQAVQDEDRGTEQEAKAADDAYPFENYTSAPSLDGGLAWINTGGPDAAIRLDDLRGKFVILDFWTYCCINCIHVLPELKKLEQAYPNEVVVIGVHSAKFAAEQDSRNIEEAVMRYEIEHPVVNDADHVIWRKFGVNSWPSFRVIDPRGNLVAGASGELTFEVLSGFLDRYLPYYREHGLLDESPVHFNLSAAESASTPLRYPGKVLADEVGDRLFIADSNHNRIVATSLVGELLYTIGSGAIGAADGDLATAEFDHPQGMALDGDVLYIADTENHLIRRVDLQRQEVTTIAGTGEQARMRFTGPPTDAAEGRRTLATPLNSPWALWLRGDDLFIAMAGPHQIWKQSLGGDLVAPYAGNGREDIVDGSLANSSFAQPSGLASDGTWLYVADSEGSSIRAVPFDETENVRTVVGTEDLPYGRLFEFGDRDGPFDEVLLQHALGVAHNDGRIYVADTYNNKIKVIDLDAETVETLAGGEDESEFDEPAGLSYADGKLYIADTNNHRIRVLNLSTSNVTTLDIDGLQPPQPKRPRANPFAGAEVVKLPPTTVSANEDTVSVTVKIALPPLQKLNELAPMTVAATIQQDAGAEIASPELARIDPPSQEFSLAAPLGNEDSGVAVVLLAALLLQRGRCGSLPH